MNDSALLIIVGIIGIAIGFALGIVVAGLRTSREEKGIASSQVDARIAPSAPRPAYDKPKPIVETTPPTSVAPIAPPAVNLGTGEIPLPTPPAQRPTLNPVGVFARALQSEVRTPQPPPKSIAGQIDDVLQEMLENSPLASRAIRLLELPNKGMVVMIGLDQYEGVDAVPDEEIKQAIRAAVTEWERRVSE
jgi:hypothetical protein